MRRGSSKVSQGNWTCAACGKSTYRTGRHRCLYKGCGAHTCSVQCRRDHHTEVHIDRYQED